MVVPVLLRGREADTVNQRGRPAVGPAVLIRFPTDLLKRIDAARGSTSRAAWLRQAATTELEREEEGQGRGAVGSGFDTTFLGQIAPLPGVGDRDVIRLDYVHFTVVLDRARRLAVTSAVNIDGADLVEVERADKWSYDPRLPDGFQVGEEVYADNDLDRGHLVRRRDPVWGTVEVARQANLDTFFYTNAAPQAARFNQDRELWLGLEDYLLEAARASGNRLNVFTGPVLDDNDPPYRGVQIPRRFYKIAAWADDGRDGVLAATGYVLDQSDELDRIDLTRAASGAMSDGIDLGGYRTYQVPITDIATLTGLDLATYAAVDRLVAEQPIGGVRRTPWKRLHALQDMTL